MPVVLPFTMVAGTKAKASQVMADFNALVAKFSEAAGGIVDADCATGMDLNAAVKLSGTVGKRITNAKLEDAAVDGRVLKVDVTAGSPLAAVNLEAHFKDNLIPKSKLSTVATKQISIAQIDILIESVAFAIGGHYNNLIGATAERITVGANYQGVLRIHTSSAAPFEIGSSRFSSGAIVPTTAIPSASRTLLAVFLLDMATPGGGVISGKMAFVSMPNT